MVADDEDDQLFICSAFATGQPFIATLSLTDGEDLLPTLRACVELPRLILLDINMPRKNGFEARGELRSVAAYAHLPVIMLTTSAADKDRLRSLALGATDFLTKPTTHEQLRALAGKLSVDWELAGIESR